VWASVLPRLSFKPEDGDWRSRWSASSISGRSRASLCVQILDHPPPVSAAVLLRLTRARSCWSQRDWVSDARVNALYSGPTTAIGLLTSVPSSALADMLRTADDVGLRPESTLPARPVSKAPSKRDFGRRLCWPFASEPKQLGKLSLVARKGRGRREESGCL